MSGFLHAVAAEAEERLRELLDTCRPPEVPPRLREAMAYAVLEGGKRLRPALCVGACAAVGADPGRAWPGALAVELVHSYSLIHDDLPTLDNDDERRGRPTCHRVFGEALALLAGDALQALAFFVLARALDAGEEAGRVAQALRELAEAAGPGGLVGGQVDDVEAEGRELDLSALEAIHRRKTGALFRASVRIGGILGGGSGEQLEALTRYGEELGLAFQIADDILDEAEERDKGKGKATYPGLVGRTEARRLAREAAGRAKEAVTVFGGAAAPLLELADLVVGRAG